MKKIIFYLPLIVILFALGAAPAMAQSEPAYYGFSGDAELLTSEELEELLAPIALYPDPLIAQILPAATFINQIQEAARFVRQGGKSSAIDGKHWDVSVKAVAHYPDVLFMMNERAEWTVALGQAFIDQQQEVMEAIQRLRLAAREQGNLYSTPQQQVVYEEEVVRIVPASPQYVYVPVYDPQVVYVERYDAGYPFITFGVGFTIGAWLNRDCDWRHRRVYYHGWRGDGWVHRARPHIHDRRGVYTNRRASVVTVNQGVLLHDSRRFRRDLRNDVRYREERGLTRPGRLDRHRPGRIEHRIDQPRQGVIDRRIDQPRPGRIDRRIEQPRPGRIDRRIDQPRPGRIDRRIEQPRPGRIDRRIEQPRPGRIEQRIDQPGRIERHSPGLQRRPRSHQPVPGAGQHRPSGRREAPASIQPPAATVLSPAATPVQPGARDVIQHRAVTPNPAPTIIPAPRSAVTPVGPAVTPVQRPAVPPMTGPILAPAPRPTAAPGARPSPAPRPSVAPRSGSAPGGWHRR